MRSEEEIRAMREVLWNLENKYAEENMMDKTLQYTAAAQVLDWVLGIGDWGFRHFLEEFVEKGKTMVL